MTLDGIPVGTLRSNLADMKVSADDWCGIFGHKYRTDADGVVYCYGCLKTLSEINEITYGKIKDANREAGREAQG
jgi:hypothetical protein